MDHEQAVYKNVQNEESLYTQSGGISESLPTKHQQWCMPNTNACNNHFHPREGFRYFLSSSIPYSGKFSREHKFSLSPCIQTR